MADYDLLSGNRASEDTALAHQIRWTDGRWDVACSYPMDESSDRLLWQSLGEAYDQQWTSPSYYDNDDDSNYTTFQLKKQKAKPKVIQIGTKHMNFLWGQKSGHI